MAEKVVVITGASSGLGAEIAQHYAGEGHALALCSRRPPALPAGDRVLSTQLDVTEVEAVDEFARSVMDRFGHIDLWINNAGVLEPMRPLEDADPDEWWRLMEINLRGVALGSRAFVRELRQAGQHGVLINISSGAAQNPYAGWTAYGASKAAVDMLSRCLQLEVAELGIRVHAVAPGIIDTQMQEQIRAAKPEDFPEVGKFLELKANDAFNSPAHVARELWKIAFDTAPQDVVLRLPPE